MRRLLFSTLTLLAACGDDPAPATQTACDPDKRPVVMAHGFLASGDTWAPFAQRFMANGYCATHLVAFDWNTLSREGAVEALDAEIDAVLAATGHTQVDLIGHSAGGGLGYQYLVAPPRAAKVNAYAHIASSGKPLQDTDPAPAGPPESPVPTLNLTSAGDEIVEGASIPGAMNIVLPIEDHYQAATSALAFADVYAFFNGGERPETTDVEVAPPLGDAPRTIAGKALTLGENAPVAGWTVAIYAVDPATGARRSATPEATFTVAANGSWGPFTAEANTHYELFLTGPNPEDRPVHYYREPFAADNPFVYLRALPSPDSLAGVLFGMIPFGDDHAVLIAFSSSQGVIKGRDSLTIAGEQLATAELASPERTSIAFFLFDDAEDQTSGGQVEAFSNVITVFLTAIDRYLAAGADPITLTFNGRTLVVPAWASSGGAVVATFD